MAIRIAEYRLYHWCGGVDDTGHRFVAKFKTLDELIAKHKQLRPKSSLYNFAALGNDYFKVVEEIIPDQCACVYMGTSEVKKEG